MDGACVENKDGDGTVYLGEGNCVANSFSFKSFSDSACTTASDKLYGDSKALADYTAFEFGKCFKLAEKKYIGAWYGTDTSTKLAVPEPPAKPKVVEKGKEVGDPLKPAEGDKKDVEVENKENAAKDKVAKEEAKAKSEKEGKPAAKVVPAGSVCKIKSVEEFTDAKCEKAVTDKEEIKKLKTAAAEWSKATSQFFVCNKNSAGDYEKITCTETGMTITLYTDVGCTTVKKVKEGEKGKEKEVDATTTYKWGECTKAASKTLKFNVVPETLPAKKGANYMAIGSAAVLALIANQF